tara:strand:- start:62 stop:613 length:552 start_codon:yes stop_codon:yes gene_type:complete
VKIELSNGISFDLGYSWDVLSNNTRIILEEYVDKVMAVPIDYNTSLPFAANLYNRDNEVIGIMNVRIYPEQEVSQNEIKNISSFEVDFFDSELKKGIENSLSQANIKLVEWKGTDLSTVNDKLFLISNYRRTSAVNKETIFSVYLFRFLDNEKSFTMTLSHNELNTDTYFSEIINIGSSIIVD